jgi:hypothetical protein
LDVTWKLFLDDDADAVRRPDVSVENVSWRRTMDLPPNPPDTSEFGEWKIARNFAEAANLIDQFGLPSFVSFDHDLADGKDGISVAHLIVNTDLDAEGKALPEQFDFEVHSGNRVGRENIRSLLEGYLFSKSTG